MSGQRVFYGVASVLVGGGLYYVYQAGGDGGVAELKMQSKSLMKQKTNYSVSNAQL